MNPQKDEEIPQSSESGLGGTTKEGGPGFDDVRRWETATRKGRTYNSKMKGRTSAHAKDVPRQSACPTEPRP